MAHRVVFTFIRHGATLSNERQEYQGWLDPPLLVKERERLNSIRHHFRTPDLVFSSDLKRCEATASLLFPNVHIEKSAQLRELHFGDFEGKCYEQLQHVPEYRQWIDHFGTAPPNGESFDTFTTRLEKGFAHILTQLTDDVTDVAIVTHGGVIRYFLATYAPIARSFWEWSVPLGGGYQLKTTTERLKEGERCISLSEVPLTAKHDGLQNNITT